MADCKMQIDTSNKFMVGATATGEILILQPPAHFLSKVEALVFAAWIVNMAFPAKGEFEEIMKEVQDG
jgi:hypothetical protein